MGLYETKRRKKKSQSGLKKKKKKNMAQGMAARTWQPRETFPT